MHVAHEYPFCVVDPSADKRSINNGWIPAQNRFYDQRLHVLGMPHVTIGKLLPGHWEVPEVTQFNVTFVPESGSLASLMAGVRPIEMFCRQHPIDHELLQQSRIIEFYA